MIHNQKTEIGSKNTISGSTINQQNANVINNDNSIYILSQVSQAKKMSVIQLILDGILELDIELQPIVLDTTDYTILEKIDHNDITSYRVAFDFYIRESFLIEYRLRFLDNNKEPTSSQRLYNFVKRIYMKHCGQANPDDRIICICNEIKDDLISTNISNEELALIPVIVFYVFSKCHIFEKPPIQP